MESNTTAQDPIVAASVDAANAWLEHCKSAARRFLKNVVIIDNEPYVAPFFEEKPGAKPAAHESIKDIAQGGSAAEVGTLIEPVDNGFGSLEESEEPEPSGAENMGGGILSRSVEVEPVALETASKIPDVKELSTIKNETETETETTVSNGAHLERGRERVQPTKDDEARLSEHVLDVRKVSDAFSEAGMACAFVLPEYQTSNVADEAKIQKRALTAASIADIVVIDWFLNADSSALTRSIIELIAQADSKGNGRLRLLCIYTGQSDLDGVFTDAKEALKAGGITTKDLIDWPYAAKSESCLLVVLNKRETTPTNLPSRIIDAFARLADGLVPSFALASIGAIRNNVHHMLTRFDVDLDAAYIGNRLITDPPEDVAELMRDLLVNECDNALGFDAISDNFLSSAVITKWLKAKEKALQKSDKSGKSAKAEKAVEKIDHEQMATTLIDQVINNLKENAVDVSVQYGAYVPTIRIAEKKLRAAVKALRDQEEATKKKVTHVDHINLGIIQDLLKYGINEKGVNYPSGSEFSAEISEKNRKHISSYLAGSTKSSVISENKFSRLVGLRKEAFGPHRSPWATVWSPSLTTGTILKLQNGSNDGSSATTRYFVCLTPACDALRLKKERAFSFVEAFKSDESYNIVVKDESGADLYLKFDTKLPEICTFKFLPSTSTRRVTSIAIAKPEKTIFQFSTVDKHSFVWMGELRYSRAVSEIGKITGTWMRIGVIDSEYLRIMSK